MAIIIKNEKQIEGIRKSCQLASEILKWIEPQVVAGVTTLKLNDLIEEYTKDHGATSAPLGYQGYPKSVCTSLNEVICHGIPSETVLKEGDILNIDVTTILDGYYGDTCKMFAIGKVSNTAKRLMETTKKCLDVGINQIKPGNRIGRIGQMISFNASMEDFSVVHQFCGHGVGVEFHEDPMIIHSHLQHESGNIIMKPGMTFTVEPMINEHKAEAKILEDGWTAVTKDGGLSAQYEHTILVTETGYEVLT